MTISEKISESKSRGHGALAMYAPAGDPDIERSIDIYRAIGAGGADVIEIGIPYSDPMMDGPILQAAYTRALKNGFKLSGLPKFIERVREVSGLPALVMTCFNPVFQYGAEKFITDIHSAGADAILLVDLPPDHWGALRDHADSIGLGTIHLATPVTSPARLKYIGSLSSPFTYCVSRMGITGARTEMGEVEKYIDSVREASKSPVMVGFGISSPDQAQAVRHFADGVIIGTALTKIVERNLGDHAAACREVELFTTSIKQALT